MNAFWAHNGKVTQPKGFFVAHYFWNKEDHKLEPNCALPFRQNENDTCKWTIVILASLFSTFWSRTDDVLPLVPCKLGKFEQSTREQVWISKTGLQRGRNYSVVAWAFQVALYYAFNRQPIYAAREAKNAALAKLWPTCVQRSAWHYHSDTKELQGPWKHTHTHTQSPPNPWLGGFMRLTKRHHLCLLLAAFSLQVSNHVTRYVSSISTERHYRVLWVGEPFGGLAEVLVGGNAGLASPKTDKKGPWCSITTS